jgi:hypothetical protein
VIKEPDSYILRKISTVYQKKFEKYIDWKYIASLDDKSLLNSLVNREDPNVLKWISTQEFDYEKNYNFLIKAWKDMYMNSPDLLGKFSVQRIYNDDFGPENRNKLRLITPSPISIVNI